MQIRGPEGKATMRGKDKQVVRGDYTMEFTGFDEYMHKLAEEGDFVLETQKGETQGIFVAGIAALNVLARVTGGEEITEDELIAAQQQATSAAPAPN